MNLIISFVLCSFLCCAITCSAEQSVCVSSTGFKWTNCSVREAPLFPSHTGRCYSNGGHIICYGLLLLKSSKSSVYPNVSEPVPEIPIERNAEYATLWGKYITHTGFHSFALTDNNESAVQSQYLHNLPSTKGRLIGPSLRGDNLTYSRPRNLTCKMERLIVPINTDLQLDREPYARHHYPSVGVKFFYARHVTNKTITMLDQVPKLKAALIRDGVHVAPYGILKPYACITCAPNLLCQLHIYLSHLRYCVQIGGNASRVVGNIEPVLLNTSSKFFDFRSHGIYPTGYETVRQSCIVAHHTYCPYGGKCNTLCPSRLPSSDCYNHILGDGNYTSSPHGLMTGLGVATYKPLNATKIDDTPYSAHRASPVYTFV